ncbi:hypothetical protein J2Z21_002417 [Streptomyces griseochromogenes]|uniref:Lipoprotein n=1 Tax=Streptomyces griseochromogenes TaxID=68214 RepID=A0A1B1AR57_9ACTN|nr:hypothetical protein [Streptomyces griseochromogenes]ANP49002.1 hypothetical protein AVL59_04900 [Streptomyces griseochromogenes]MBP2049486.1 hypothetical protein [Streptomyces griseochromogenes]
MAGRPLICAAASVALLLTPALAAAAPADDTGDPGARELAREAEDHLLHTHSLHMTWTDRTAATKKGEVESMDLALDRDGNCVGTVRKGADGGAVEIVKRGDEVWMKADRAYWKAELSGSEGNAAAEMFKDRYVHGTTHDGPLKSWGKACDLNAFQKDMTGSFDEESLAKGDRTEVDGIPVIPLKGEEDGTPFTLYVTSDSPHLLVGGTLKGDGTDLTVKFSDYGEPVPSATPSVKESVDVSKLEDLENR